jgi:hypothetical protein
MAGLLEGLPIVDAEEEMDLHVIKSDINRRSRKDPAHCALAECLHRQTGNPEVRVYLSRAYVRAHNRDLGDHWVRYEVGQMARREITAYDRGGAFMPGVYRLYVPRPNTEYMRGTQPKKGKSRRPRHIPQLTANIRPRAAVIKNKKKRR